MQFTFHMAMGSRNRHCYMTHQFVFNKNIYWQNNVLTYFINIGVLTWIARPPCVKGENSWLLVSQLIVKDSGVLTTNIINIKKLCICVLGVSILPLYTILIFDFGIVPTVIFFVFHLILKKENLHGRNYSANHPRQVGIMLDNTCPLILN